MSKRKQNSAGDNSDPTNVFNHLPFWLPIVQPKKKKKCCKKHKKGKRCKSCPAA